MNVVPLTFAWNKEKAQSVERSVLEKLNGSRTEEEEATDTASEGEGDISVSIRTVQQLISRKTQTFEDGFFIN